MSKEIERNWLWPKDEQTFNYPNARALLSKNLYSCIGAGTVVRQYAPYASPNTDIRFSKYMKIGREPEYRLCFKNGSGMIRDELEIIIGEDEYKGLQRMYPSVPVIKEYSVYNIDGHTFVNSDAHPDPDYLPPYEPIPRIFSTEIEFESVEEANGFMLPPELNRWKEITDSPRYRMKNIWKRFQVYAKNNV